MLEVPITHSSSDRYIAHRLMIGNFRVALTLAARERSIIVSWRDADHLPMKPDGFFSLQFPWLPDGKNRAHFFLECDRSTETRKRFQEKLEAYAAWDQRGGRIEALGIKRFRVLTVTKSEERLRSLFSLAPPGPIFWCSTY